MCSSSLCSLIPSPDTASHSVEALKSGNLKSHGHTYTYVFKFIAYLNLTNQILLGNQLQTHVIQTRINLYLHLFLPSILKLWTSCCIKYSRIIVRSLNSFKEQLAASLRKNLTTRISAGVDDYPCFTTFYCYDPY